MPLVPTPSARTISQSHPAGTARASDWTCRTRKTDSMQRPAAPADFRGCGTEESPGGAFADLCSLPPRLAHRRGSGETPTPSPSPTVQDRRGRRPTRQGGGSTRLRLTPTPPSGVQGCQGRCSTGQGGGGSTRLRERRHREHQQRSRRPRMWTQRSTSNCPKGGLQSSKPR